jgi:hypothetical protein
MTNWLKRCVLIFSLFHRFNQPVKLDWLNIYGINFSQKFRFLGVWVKSRAIASLCIGICMSICLTIALTCNSQPVAAKLTDDAYDGNIFALYGGNGSIVPPRMTLSQSLQQGRAAMLVFYVDDSADCKRFSPILNLAQGLYSKNLSLIAVPVDSLNVQRLGQSPQSLTPLDEAYYYRGAVPQTVLISGEGQVSFDQEGLFGFEELDVAIRDLLGLQDTPPSTKFRKTDRPINEVNP